MAGEGSTDAHLNGLLASLENHLGKLVQARDPATAEIAYELQNAIDNIRAELGQIADPLALRKRANE